MGMGPRSGRGAGYCGGYGMPGYANPAAPRMGMGWRRGWGGGGRGGWGGARGWGRHFGHGGWGRYGYGYAPAWGAPAGYYEQPTPEQETDFLKEQAKWLQEQLEGISDCIAELEK